MPPGLLPSALIRVIPVALVVSTLAAVAGHWHAQRVTELADVRMLTLEAQRAIPAGIMDLPAAERASALHAALNKMVGGVFTMAAVYTPSHQRLAEVVQPGFEAMATAIEAQPASMPRGGAAYDRLSAREQDVLRVLIPLGTAGGTFAGHLEGVRVISPTEHTAFEQVGLESAAIAALAAMLCAAVLAPLLTYLAARNLKWAQVMTDAHIGMLEALGRAIDKRDSDTAMHNYRVTWMAARLGEAIGLPAQHMRSLIAGAFLHDLGKIGIADAILLKPGALDARERAVMQSHVALGGQIAGDAGFLRYARDVIEGHHEKWDGSGYPSRVAGAAIPLAARIFCIADVYDALRAKRPYKPAYGFDFALVHMRAGRGTHFDPVLWDRFEMLVHEIELQIFQASDAAIVERTRAMVRQHFHSEANDRHEDVSW